MDIDKDFLSGSVVKNLPGHAGDSGDAGSILGLRRSPGGGNGNLLQYFFLENPMDRGAWQAIVQRIVKNQTRLSDNTHTHRWTINPTTRGTSFFLGTNGTFKKIDQVSDHNYSKPQTTPITIQLNLKSQ